MDGAAKRRAIDAQLSERGHAALTFTEPSYDDAILGLVFQGHGDPFVLYDGEAIVALITADIMLDDPTLSPMEAEDQARDHYDYNVLGSTPEGCPFIFEPVDEMWDPLAQYGRPEIEPDQAHAG